MDHLSAGVPGLDEILGGGVPERSFTIITGQPGSGKTTLAQQIAFASASEEHQAVYFCGVGESIAKLCAHLQPLTFFDTSRLERDVHFVDLSPHATEREAGRAVDLVAHALETGLPGIVVVDIPRSLTPPTAWTELGVLLAGCPATTILVNDGEPTEALLSLADTVLRMGPRTISVDKARGRDILPGQHATRIDERGLRIFPRWPTPRLRTLQLSKPERLSTGVEGIDALIGGGIQPGHTTLVEGPSGTGKSILATQFLAETAHQGSPALIVLSDERPDRWIARGEQLGLEVERLVQTGLLEVISARGRDVLPDELTYLVERKAMGMRARSIVWDSAVGLELLFGGATDMRDWFWRMLDRLTCNDTAVWVNHARAENQLGTLFDNVIRLRRTEHSGQILQRIELAKTSAASTVTELVPYEIGAKGLRVSVHEHTQPLGNGHLVPYRLAANGR